MFSLHFCQLNFSCTDRVEGLFLQAGFYMFENEYVHRRTVNKKEGIDVPRIFIQAKFQKPFDEAYAM